MMHLLIQIMCNRHLLILMVKKHLLKVALDVLMKKCLKHPLQKNVFSTNEDDLHLGTHDMLVSMQSYWYNNNVDIESKA